MTDENGWKSIGHFSKANNLNWEERRKLGRICIKHNTGDTVAFQRDNGEVLDVEVERRPPVQTIHPDGPKLFTFVRPISTAPTLPWEGKSVTVSSPAAADVKPDITLADAFVVAANIHRHLALSPSLEGNNRRLAHFACAVAIRKLELDAREMEANR